MEDFSEEQKVNAVKFVTTFLSQSSGVDSSQLRPSRPQFTTEELEGECLHMGRRFLSEKGCPGILSYHISHHATQKVVTGSMDGLWQPDLEEGEKPHEVEEQGEKEEQKEESDQEHCELQFLSAAAVATVLLAAMLDVCQEWAKSLPQLTQVPGSIELSVHAIKNTRRKMEDRHAVCVDINSLFGLQGYPPQSYYAVFDGHVAVEAADYASVHVLPNIVRHKDFKSDPASALKGGILTTDHRFCKINQRAGSTAVVALVRGSTLHVAWAGDSQAMLFRRGQGIQLVTPHKPDREDERERIEEQGGMVIWLGAWRVNGNLSVSRAIGDGKDKKFICGDADTNTVELDGTEDFLVVACDGVWDVLDAEEIAQEVWVHFSSGGAKQTLARRLIDAARREGSGDNMTVIVPYFHTFQVPTGPPSKQAQEVGVASTGDDPGTSD